MITVRCVCGKSVSPEIRIYAEAKLVTDGHRTVVGVDLDVEVECPECGRLIDLDWEPV